MKRRSALCLFLSAVILLAGCWDKKELSDIAFVMGLGINLTENGMYEVYFQIVNPGKISGRQKGSSGSGSAVTVYTEKGETLFEAIRKASKVVPRRLTFSHTAMLVIGERLAKSGRLATIFDFTNRYYKFRSTTLVFIAMQGSGKTPLAIVNPLEQIPAVKVSETMEKTDELWGTNIKLNINGVTQALASKSRGLTISGLTVTGNVKKGQMLSGSPSTGSAAVVKIGGLAIFRKGKLIGWVKREDARGINWVRDKIDKTVVNIPCTKNKAAMAVEVLRTYTKVTPVLKKDMPQMKISILAEGNLQEAPCPIDLTKPEAIKELNRKFAAKVKKEVLGAVNTAQKMKTDVFGFGEAINRANPRVWKGLEKNWNETFSKMEVKVNVQFMIRRMGLRTKPLTKIK
ncbi:MAG TPA: Ger(x)C family spore germination protein [Bacillales bacterium]